jgi:hypothetical protein
VAAEYGPQCSDLRLHALFQFKNELLGKLLTMLVANTASRTPHKYDANTKNKNNRVKSIPLQIFRQSWNGPGAAEAQARAGHCHSSCRHQFMDLLCWSRYTYTVVKNNGVLLAGKAPKASSDLCDFKGYEIEKKMRVSKQDSEASAASAPLEQTIHTCCLCALLEMRRRQKQLEGSVRNIKCFEDVDVQDFFDAPAAVEVDGIDRDKYSARFLSLTDVTPNGSSSKSQRRLWRMVQAMFAIEAHQV